MIARAVSPRRDRVRTVGAAVGFVVLAGAAGLSINAARSSVPAVSAGGGSVSLAARTGLVARSTADDSRGNLISVSASGGRRVISRVRCERLYAAAGTGICLRLDGDLTTYQLAVLDSGLRVRREIPLVGIPNRARVSPSGHLVAWTVFVTGDSYNGGRFSTRVGILDTRSQTLVPTLEDWAAAVAGKPYKAKDLNFWGVTFAADDRFFYATMSTGGHRYLIQGDLATRSLRTLAENVECPSLAPDGKRIAFKAAKDGNPRHGWRLSVLTLASGRVSQIGQVSQVIPLAETRSVDDQAAWLDAHTVAYALRRGREHADVWAVPADGTGAPRVLVPDAESPAPLGTAPMSD
ncbi:hypothetical protein J4573_46050 [Actinomadura barringtoniae]|uniref:TolB-like translocation protein n=1 Tax=Actinomadura barringtoniae TaxID=1427535 RepID=A0A939PSY9_9ACTN|nr:hypothetical protein [Actinomadura barringtoniae]MBO2454519.1 hypothetical protein [Actinomadura barringtoniae]